MPEEIELDDAEEAALERAWERLEREEAALPEPARYAAHDVSGERRDEGGQWTEEGGKGDTADAAEPHAMLHADAEKAATAGLRKTGPLAALGAPGRWAKDKAKELYGALEGRYGRAQALAIMAAGQLVGWGATAAGAAVGVPVWLPGSTLWGSAPFAALAELYLQLKRGAKAVLGKGEKAAYAREDDAAELTPEEIEALGARLVKELVEACREQERAEGEPEPESSEALKAVKAAVADLTPEEWDGIRVMYHPDPPRVWLDVMDWGDDKVGNRLEEAFIKAVGRENVERVNEGGAPDKAQGWVDIEGGKGRHARYAAHDVSNEPRDPAGKWTEGGGHAGGGADNGGMTHEFKVKPPRKLYRGVMNDGRGAGTYSLGKGLYSTPTKSFLKGFKYDKIIELDPQQAFPRNPLVLRQASEFPDWLLRESGMKNMREFNARYSDPGEFVRSKGHDGVVAGDEVVKYPDREPEPTPPANPPEGS